MFRRRQGQGQVWSPKELQGSHWREVVNADGQRIMYNDATRQRVKKPSRREAREVWSSRLVDRGSPVQGLSDILKTVEAQRRQLEDAKREAREAREAMQAAIDEADRCEEEQSQAIPQTECVVCLTARVTTLLAPCGHLCICSMCASKMKAQAEGGGDRVACPLCRSAVSEMHRAFLPSTLPAPACRNA